MRTSNPSANYCHRNSAEKKSFFFSVWNSANLNVSLFVFAAILIWDLIFQQISGTFFFFFSFSNDGWKNMLHCSFRPFVILCANGNEPRMKKKIKKKFFYVRIWKTVQCLRSFCRENGRKRQLKIMRLVSSLFFFPY